MLVDVWQGPKYVPSNYLQFHWRFSREQVFNKPVSARDLAKLYC